MRRIRPGSVMYETTRMSERQREQRVDLVVFLRGVNVGRHKRFQPGLLARELPFDVVNVGAAGTFVVRKPVSPASLRTELLRRLPFEAEVMICRGRDLVELTRRRSFPEEQSHPDAQRFVSVLGKRPAKIPRLPVSQPAGEAWQVKLVEVCGAFALTLWRRGGKRLLYPNEVVEKTFGMRVTTRNWNTISAICGILEGGGSSSSASSGPRDSRRSRGSRRTGRPER